MLEIRFFFKNIITVKAAVSEKWNACFCIKKHITNVDKVFKQRWDACNFDSDKDKV